MKLKIKSIIISGILLVLVFLIFGCVDEPVVDPVNRPFSTIRIANLSSNITSMNVYMDNTQPVFGMSNLTLSNLTQYYDVNSGSRYFVVENSVTGDTIYAQELQVNSYGIITVTFTGYYTPIKKQNTFLPFIYIEGDTYINTAPQVDKTSIFFINTATGTDSLAANKYHILVKFKGLTDTTYKDIRYVESLAYTKSFSMPDSTPGNYLFDVKTDKGLAITVFPSDSSFDALSGKLYYLFLHGPPDNIMISKNEQDPRPVRPK